jgi:hypothetical protein
MDNIWENKGKILEGITNTLARNRYIEYIAQERYSICKACPHLSTDCAPLIKECCNECGCSVKFKTHSLTSSCPINKWLAIQTDDSK